MSLLRRIGWAALAGGLAAGLLLFVLQAVWVTPLIHRAERYETAPAHASTPAATSAGNAAPAGPPAAGLPATGASAMGAPAPAPEGWAPAEGLQRIGLTALSDVLAAVGFALLLLAGMTVRGAPVSVRSGIQWGLAGYAAFVLAPALGLPPELPGAAAAGLAERQLWWSGTVVASAAGLALLTFAPGWIKPLGGLALLAPHALGAPRPPLDVPELLPAALAGQYVAAVLVTSAVFWAVLGGACGWFLERQR